MPAARAQIEMIIAASIDAEFEAYRALPAIDEAKLVRWYAGDGPAYRDLVEMMERHRI